MATFEVVKSKAMPLDDVKVFNRHEIAGGFGDLGLLLPVSLALITVNGLSATAVFLTAGLAYLLTAFYFKVPIPVQPLKAVAAVALALKLDASVIAAAAISIGVVMCLLSVTGLATKLAKLFPLVLVRGIQASVALLLVKASITLASKGNWKGMPAIDSKIAVAVVAVACGLLLLLSRYRTAVPGVFVVLLGGLVVGVAFADGLPEFTFGPTAVSFSIPDISAFGTALTTLVLAQLPLTFGNSVVATVDVERKYFGDRADRVTPSSLAASIGVSNLVSGFVGGLPLCHGAGGATAHYRLGARRAVSTASIGLVLVVIALVFGASIPSLIKLITPGVLAGMLMFVAIEHGLLAFGDRSWLERALVALVGVTTLLSGNLAVGFLVGTVFYVLGRLAGMLKEEAKVV